MLEYLLFPVGMCMMKKEVAKCNIGSPIILF